MMIGAGQISPITMVLKLHPENLYAINGARSCIREHFCSDVRCVGKFGQCLFCSRTFCLSCENVPKLLTKVLLQHRHGGLSIFILHSLLGRTVE
ncbi:uncharacterized protein LOC109846490 isoform X6 [Asparagus officinalis]|uniref:uncharacterized protein LOC109846490 isoform X6 n=1 Tax=Asparagus officinalis TaxID=4686 RepID=UPI00098E1AD9|nr:uncharacterized protein LOC109846490 isoform X6 [Asparagus officinalis]